VGTTGDQRVAPAGIATVANPPLVPGLTACFR
jgi:hypothetical protein